MRNQGLFRVLLRTALPLALAATANAQVSGTVVESGTLTPIPDALVTLQTTTVQTTTSNTSPVGEFTLAGASGTNLVITAAKKGYFNGSVLATTPATGVMITLDPVPQHTNPAYTFGPPSNCGLCHSDQFAEWSGTPMALAGDNLWVYDIYNGTGTAGGMGGFVYTRDSAFATSNPESECASCHQPEPWIISPHSALEDITNLSPQALHGISCDVCHKVAHIDETKLNFPGIYPGTVDFTRPNAGFDQVMYGVLGDSDFVAFGTMRSSYQPQIRAEVCAACHQDKNDPDDDGDFEEANGIISEPTYFEWLNSPYADPNSGITADCVDCHMPATTRDYACTILGLTRDPETIRSHKIEGTTPEFLENAVEMDVDVSRSPTVLTVDVDITNSLTGHHVPTGVTVRNMILLVEVTRESDGLVLTHTGAQTIHDLGGIGANAATGDFAGLPGKLYAKHNEDAGGNGPTFFTDAVAIRWDNRIPALATDSTQYTFDIPAGTERINVHARLIYRRAFRFLTLAKNWTVDGHGNPLADVAAPHFGHLMEEYDGWSIPGVELYGCGTNPAGSMSVISGTPNLNTAFTMGVDNPLGTQAVGSFPFVAIAKASDPNFPCGTPLPNWGMSGAGMNGELLISLLPPNPIKILVGAPWAGAGTPAGVTLNFPGNANLVGKNFYAQGVMFDPTAAFGVKFGLTDALQLTVGP